MKVGIVTQPFAKNYGGIMQNYALQQVLKKLGHEPLTFEYDTCYTPFRWLLRTAKAIVKQRTLKKLPAYPYKGRIGHIAFIEFIIKHINSVPTIHFTKELISQNNIEACIVGSDQVWRPGFHVGNQLYNMYLDFVPDDVLKLSYAASFGMQEWEYSEEQTQQCKQLIKRFVAVSLRENAGVNNCKKYFDVEPEQVLDPTLLLEKEDYMAICKEVPVSTPHIFVYGLNMSADLLNTAEIISHEKYLPIVQIQADNGVKEDDSIEKWIAEFRDAEYIVTNSFHGLAFSIIFNKPFSVVIHKSGGASRIVSILSMLGLNDRIVSDKHPNTETIDYTKINSILSNQREQSIYFLKKNLS